MKRLLIGIIEKYQASGGGEKVFGVECNFTPSCSQYTKLAILKYGAIKGLNIGLNRIKRCNNKYSTQKIIDNLD